MAIPKWFDYSAYMNNKLTQMRALEGDDYTMAMLDAAFSKAGYVGDEGAYRHFMKWGVKEDVSPNALFDTDYYYKAKALSYYTSAEGGGVDADTVLAHIDRFAYNVKGLIKAAGMSAWEHFINWGTKEGINPSSLFDTSSYMEAKLDALQESEPDRNWTYDSMCAAFKKAKLNALEHFMQYAGTGENEVADGLGPDGSVPDAFKVPADEVIADSAGQSGHTFTFTSGTTVLTHDTSVNASPAGTHLGVSDDTVNAYSFLSTGDTVIDPSTTDHDVMNATVASNAAPSVTNMETLNLEMRGGVLSLGDVQGTNTVNLKMAGDGGLARIDPAGEAAFNITGGTGEAVFGFTRLSGNSDTLDLSLTGFKGGVTLGEGTGGYSGVLEKLKITTLGEEASSIHLDVDGMDVRSVSSIDVSGSQDLEIRVDSDDVVSGAAKVSAIARAEDFTGRIAVTLAGDGTQAITNNSMDLAKYQIDSVTLGQNTDNGEVPAGFTLNNASSGLDVTLLKGAGTSLKVGASQAVTSGKADELGVTVGGETAALGDLDVTGFEKVALDLSSSKSLTITSLTHTNNAAADDTLTITGVRDLTISNVLAFDGLDASAFTGRLTLASGQTDLSQVKGGSGNDKLFVGTKGARVDAGDGNDTVTVNSGAADIALTGGKGGDVFDVTANSAGSTSAFRFTTITDFGNGQDKIVVGAVNSVNDADVNTDSLSAASSDEAVFAVLNAVAASSANDVLYLEWNDNTYVRHANAASGLTADDVLVKLTGFDGDLAASDFAA